MGRPRSLVYGVGVNDHEDVVHVNGKLIPIYNAWKNMLQRCYSDKCQDKNPTYIGCSVSNEWLYFTKFKVWYDNNYIQGWALDKDLLIIGNKVYSPKTCTYVPLALNILFCDHTAKRGEWPQGVDWQKQNCKFRACLRVNGKFKHLGYFSTPEAASNAYQNAKNNYVKNEINRYRELYSDNKPLMILLSAMEARI